MLLRRRHHQPEDMPDEGTDGTKDAPQADKPAGRSRTRKQTPEG